MSFNHKKINIYDEALHAVLHKQSLLIFVDGKAGHRKMYLICDICNKIQSLGKIVIPTTTSVFVAQAYAGGHTTHSTFVKCISLTLLNFV